MDILYHHQQQNNQEKHICMILHNMDILNKYHIIKHNNKYLIMIKQKNMEYLDNGHVCYSVLIDSGGGDVVDFPLT